MEQNHASVGALPPIRGMPYAQMAEHATAAIVCQGAQDALRDHKTRFQTLVQQFLQGILVHDKHQLLFANQVFATMFGYARPDDILSHVTILSRTTRHDCPRIMAYCETGGRRARPLSPPRMLRHRGQMRVERVEGQGTTFTITLARLTAEAARQGCGATACR